MKLPPPVLSSSGQPKLCSTRPGSKFASGTCHISLMPMPNFWGSLPSDRLNFEISVLASEPRTPSAMNTYLPCSSMPGW